jgi:hypothetical protein
LRGKDGRKVNWTETIVAKSYPEAREQFERGLCMKEDYDQLRKMKIEGREVKV